MREVKQIEIKNRTYYFYNDTINLKTFEWGLWKIDKKQYKGSTNSDTNNIYNTNNIYYIRYITIKKIDDCENIYNVNPLYLLVNPASGYIEENNENKYIIFDDSINENKELLKKHTDVWDEIKNKIKAINDSEENDYRKDYMKIKFSSDDDLPLNKPLTFQTLTIIIISVFEEGGKLYPQVFLDDALHEL